MSPLQQREQEHKRQQTEEEIVRKQIAEDNEVALKLIAQMPAQAGAVEEALNAESFRRTSRSVSVP